MRIVGVFEPLTFGNQQRHNQIQLLQHQDSFVSCLFLLIKFLPSAKNNTCVVNGAKRHVMCEIWNKNQANVLCLEQKSVILALNGVFSYQFSHIVANFDLTKMESFAKKGVVLIYILWYFILRRLVVHHLMFSNSQLPVENSVSSYSTFLHPHTKDIYGFM